MPALRRYLDLCPAGGAVARHLARESHDQHALGKPATAAELAYRFAFT